MSKLELQVARMSSLREESTSGDIYNEWEELCPELFALILKAVQQNAGREAGEARRVVALAGVCRRWRHLIQQSYSSPLAEMGLMQFPFALRQPGPCHQPVHCLLKRRGGSFVLFQQNIGDGGTEKLDFLMAARREWRACGSCFAISASHTNFSKTGHAYMGKLRSDFWSADFSLWEATGNQQKSKRLVLRISFSDCMREGMRQRAMVCELYDCKRPTSSSGQWSHVPQAPAGTCISRRQQPSPSSASSTAAAAEAYTQMITVRYSAAPISLLSCLPAMTAPVLSRSRLAAAPKKQKAAVTFLRSYSSMRRANLSFSEKSNVKAGGRAEVGGEHAMFVMESKAPHWDDQSQCWSLDFHGRSSLPSHYNFQLVRPPTCENPSDTILLQLGKVGRGLYSLDYCHPLSAFQAFSICLSSFATKVGVDP
ncbi:hypothetical protein GOP47_0015098 [Adiantum capillus-veneris]|uniref:Tubby C-terminal domain-containing protein n=1 Tax=Adiantum capillus-veneris TaxID=13818 RepID=A0A9D4UMP5_ADICA|nr:hypothetical protein GOP47_0015098 [Adiantum capillus-veneris]